jgi:hypothetical protein
MDALHSTVTSKMLGSFLLDLGAYPLDSRDGPSAASQLMVMVYIKNGLVTWDAFRYHNDSSGPKGKSFSASQQDRTFLALNGEPTPISFRLSVVGLQPEFNPNRLDIVAEANDLRDVLEDTLDLHNLLSVDLEVEGHYNLPQEYAG